MPSPVLPLVNDNGCAWSRQAVAFMERSSTTVEVLMCPVRPHVPQTLSRPLSLSLSLLSSDLTNQMRDVEDQIDRKTLRWIRVNDIDQRRSSIQTKDDARPPLPFRLPQSQLSPWLLQELSEIGCFSSPAYRAPPHPESSPSAVRADELWFTDFTEPSGTDLLLRVADVPGCDHCPIRCSSREHLSSPMCPALPDKRVRHALTTLQVEGKRRPTGDRGARRTPTDLVGRNRSSLWALGWRRDRDSAQEVDKKKQPHNDQLHMSVKGRRRSFLLDSTHV